MSVTTGHGTSARAACPTPPRPALDLDGDGGGGRSSAALVVVCILLASIPALLTAFLVWRYTVDVPIIDQWSMVEDLEAAANQRWSAAEIVRSHNGHRIAVARLILVPLALLSGWNVRVEVALNLLAAGSLLLVLGAGFAPRPLPDGLFEPRTLLAFAASSIAVFSLAQWENWLWGLQLQVFLVMLFAVAALLVLSRSEQRWRRWGVAVLLALLASFSQGAGLVVWPAGLVLLAVHPGPARRRALLCGAWALVAALVVAFYLQELPGDAGVRSAGAWIERPAVAVGFVLTVLGAPVASFTGSAWPPKISTVAPVAGALLLVVSAALLVAGWRRAGAPPRELLFAGAVLLLAVGVAAQIALGRAQMGLPAAMASRYVTFAGVAWAASLALSVSVATSAARYGAGARAAAAWAALACLGLLVSSLMSIPNFPSRQVLLAPARQALIDGEPEDLLARLHPELHQVTAGLPVLRDYRLSVFREPRWSSPQPSIEVLSSFDQRLTSRWSPAAVAPGARFTVPTEVHNPSDQDWPTRDETVHSVNLSYRWIPLDGGVGVNDGERTFLPWRLEAGESVVLRADVAAPPSPGTYTLRLSMVQEGVAWFDDRGAPPLDLRVVVAAAPAQGAH